jgi:uncharacterized membrane protein YphA (DoxX/SURF4 family)
MKMALRILMSLLNVVSVFFIALGHLDLAGDAILFTGYALLPITLGVLLAIGGYTILTYFSRAIVGGLFVVSGMVKANDPLGFSYKLEEYFSEGALDWPSFVPYALDLSILICVAEIVLGLAVLLGGKMKFASWSLLAMIGFFVWLTFYTASCIDREDNWTMVQMVNACEAGEDMEVAKARIDKEAEEREKADCVRDCGCFGDAMKGSVGRSLTPWESFAKDVVLLYFVLILLFRQNVIKFNTPREDALMIPSGLLVIGFLCWVFDSWWFPLIFSAGVLLLSLLIKRLNMKPLSPQWMIALFAGLASYGFAMWCYTYLPMKDYRPYRVGVSIPEQMVYPEGAQQSEIEMTFYYCVNGEVQGYTDLKEIPEGATFVGRKDKVIKYGYIPPIEDFEIKAGWSQLSDAMKNGSAVQAWLADQGLISVMVDLQNTETGETVQVYDWELDSDTTYQNKERWKELKRTNSFEEPQGDEPIDITQDILGAEYVLLLISCDLEKYSDANQDVINELADAAMEQGIPFYFICPADPETRKAFVEEHGGKYPAFQADNITLKAMIRSNPGLFLLNKGTILNKWSTRSITSFDEMADEYLN